ncbi:alpha-L-fucosidase [Flagellimonas hymeniacidonis]|uniref:alpha-L-fucosidase n=1 Tax=Flagellimonas hymeniacidonis TaxID=2603628 RepID=A0A5C8V0J6_9FLAO|nr:alpha-L-fucosidase [Flagellimonas hymeniacidonis]TXN34320.1 alpha-L-fucosidase [Flagellimonas hymeniacidonis]
MKKILQFVIAGAIILSVSCNSQIPPEPVGPVPSERQLAWHELEYYAFVHFNMNTFTDMEWGTGGETPAQFNPTQLDTRQWAKVGKEAGMKGIILTAKHHDGFCLWPTKTTEHSVKNSPWKNGQGDLVQDLADACKEYGLKLGLYLSPWDRNNEHYGKPEYVQLFHEQLRELLTNYGELFEVWFDGANGGSGYYGGANETRKIDNKTYYEWPKTTQMIRELQPNAVIFSDGGPDVRWVGNEEGWANETNWSVMRRDEIHPGWPRYVELRSGHEDGTHWLPAEVNTSIRPGWYYHPGEDHQVKTLPRLVQTFYESVGRNGNFLLNLPVDDRGLVHEKDVEQLLALKQQIDKDFANELAQGQTIVASDVRGNDSAFSAENAIDGDKESYWATNDGKTQASITVSFEEPTEVNRIILQEYIPLGQRVKKFKVSAEVSGEWKTIDEQTTIGNKRILQFETVKADKIQVEILDSKGPVTLSNLELYRAPVLLVEPVFSRNRDGMVSISVPDDKVDIYFTTNGSDPTTSSSKYTKPFSLTEPAIVKAIAVDSDSGQQTQPANQIFDIAKKEWHVIAASSGNLEDAEKLMDGNPDTFWATDKEDQKTPEITIDLGKSFGLTGFTYWPIQTRYPFGIITHYEFLVSVDNKNWKTAAKGEFGNVANNRIEQKVSFETTSGRYIKLKALKIHGEDPRVSFGEIGVLTK